MYQVPSKASAPSDDALQARRSPHASNGYMPKTPSSIGYPKAPPEPERVSSTPNRALVSYIRMCVGCALLFLLIHAHKHVHARGSVLIYLSIHLV